MLLNNWRFRDLILEMSRWAAWIRIKLLVAISVDRLRLCALLLLLLLLAQAWLAYHLVAFFVHEQFALDALESLPSEAPDPILTERAEGPLQIKPTKGIILYYLLNYPCWEVYRGIPRSGSRAFKPHAAINTCDAPTLKHPGTEV